MATFCLVDKSFHVIRILCVLLLLLFLCVCGEFICLFVCVVLFVVFFCVFFCVWCV